MSSMPSPTLRISESNSFLTEDPLPLPPSPQAHPHSHHSHDPFFFHHPHQYPPTPLGTDTQDKEDPQLKLEISLITPPWRKNLYLLLEQPTSSPQAFLTHIFITSLIVLSALVTVLETIPALHSVHGGMGKFWFGVETALVVLFTIEYIGRCVAWSYNWLRLAKWIVSFFGIIDLLSVMPYYIELMLGQDTSVLFRFSILRMFRLLRVFRPFRSNSTVLLTIEVMYLSVRRSQHALLAIGFFVSMVLTVFSTLLYFAERGKWDETLETFLNSDGDPTQFQSIPAAAWFVLVTITTVGYGEITPRSFLGRLVTLPLLVFGLLLITLPSFVLGREFSIVWEKMSRDQTAELELEIDREVENSRARRRSMSASKANGHAVPGVPDLPGEPHQLGEASDSDDDDVSKNAGTATHSYSHLPTNSPSGEGDAIELEAQVKKKDKPRLTRVYSSSQPHLPLESSSTALASGSATKRMTRPNLFQAIDNGTNANTPPSDGRNQPQAQNYGHAQGLGYIRDLSNRKLAMNQTELSKQILELKQTVEVQGKMLERLLSVLEGRTSETARGDNWKGKGKAA